MIITTWLWLLISFIRCDLTDLLKADLFEIDLAVGKLDQSKIAL